MTTETEKMTFLLRAMYLSTTTLERSINYQRCHYEDYGYIGPKENGSYPFIPMNTQRTVYDFIMLQNILQGRLPENASDTIRDVRNLWDRTGATLNKKFLDAGCGIGNIMLLAHTTGFCHRIHGIEYFDDTYQKAIAWLGMKGLNNNSIFKIFRDDILKFKNYGDYDVIYYYRPFEDTKKQDELEKLIENSMKVGAILMPRLKKREGEIRKDKRFINIFEKEKNPLTDSPIEPIYIKVKG
jgi:SAM-dependent methyltransferase